MRPSALIDAKRDGILEVAQRAANGDDGFADLQLIRIAELRHGGHGAVDFDDGQIGKGVGADQLGGHLRAIGKDHFQGLIAIDDVIVGDDVTLR